jgi:hypothetical protein
MDYPARAHAYLLTLVFSTFSPANDDNYDANNEHHQNCSHYNCNNNGEMFNIQFFPPAYLNCKKGIVIICELYFDSK